jgi:hypothetical protein
MMKPSDRITELYDAELATFDESEREHIETQLPSKTHVLVRAIAAYLDERHERERLNEEVFTLALVALTGRTPDLPPRAQEILAELVAYPARNWSIPEPPDYAEALLRYWCERTGRSVP